MSEKNEELVELQEVEVTTEPKKSKVKGILKKVGIGLGIAFLGGVAYNAGKHAERKRNTYNSDVEYEVVDETRD